MNITSIAVICSLFTLALTLSACDSSSSSSSSGVNDDTPACDTTDCDTTGVIPSKAETSSNSKAKSSSSEKATPNNDKGGDEVKSSSSSKGESNFGYDYLWKSAKESLRTACSSDEDQKGKKALSAYSDSCIYVCAFNDSLDRWM